MLFVKPTYLSVTSDWDLAGEKDAVVNDFSLHSFSIVPVYLQIVLPRTNLASENYLSFSDAITMGEHMHHTNSPLDFRSNYFSWRSRLVVIHKNPLRSIAAARPSLL